MQAKKRSGDDNDMHSVVMSYDDLWPGIEERLLEQPPTRGRPRSRRTGAWRLRSRTRSNWGPTMSTRNLERYAVIVLTDRP